MIGEQGGSRKRLERMYADFRRESREAREARWRGHFDSMAAPSGNLVLFGAGQIGQWILQRLRRAGVDPCCFSDNNPRLWGARVGDAEVLSPTDARDRFGSNATFVVTIFNGSVAREQLRGMGCRYVVPLPVLPWKYPAIFIPDLGIDSPGLLVDQEAQIRACFDLLADEASRQELCDQLEWRYWFRPEFLPRRHNPEEVYFPEDLIAPSSGEAFVDCGAFDGDSIRSFLQRHSKFSHIDALEPDPANRAVLQAFLATQNHNVAANTTVWPYAASNQSAKVTFEVSGDVTSRVSSGGNGMTVEARRLDSFDWPVPPTYVKMDIEGSEPQAIAGASGLLQQHMPVLAVCLYHRSEHLWQIPALIHSIEPRYSLFLRRYAEDCWEQICYAVPPQRIARRAA